MRALAGILVLLLLGAERNVCAGCGIDSKARIIVWPQSNDGAASWANIESRSIANATAGAGLRVNVSHVGGLRVSASLESAPDRAAWPLPAAIERLTVLVDSPHSVALERCRSQRACESALGSDGAIARALRSPSLWLRVIFASSISQRVRRDAEVALCEFLGTLVAPVVGFDAGVACSLPAVPRAQRSHADSNTRVATESIWQRHNLTSPSLIVPDSKLAPVPVELLAFLWPEYDTDIGGDAASNFDALQLDANLDSLHRFKYMRYALPSVAVPLHSGISSLFQTRTAARAAALHSWQTQLLSLVSDLVNSHADALGLPLVSVRARLDAHNTASLRSMTVENTLVTAPLNNVVARAPSSPELVVLPCPSDFPEALAVRGHDVQNAARSHHVHLSAVLACRPSTFAGHSFCNGTGVRTYLNGNISAVAMQKLEFELENVFALRPSRSPASTYCHGNIQRSLDKSGLHRNLLTRIRLGSPPSSSHESPWPAAACAASPLRPVCWLWALETVPDSTYIDPFEIQELARFGGPESCVYGVVDIEKPFSLAAHDTVSTVYRNENALHWSNLSSPAGVTLDLQVHLRYHTPSSASFANFSIPPPMLFVKCSSDKKLLRSMPWQRLEILDEGAPHATEFLNRVERVAASIPVGELADDQVVLITTFACTIGAVVWIISALVAPGKVKLS